jgi:hypothetical protein
MHDRALIEQSIVQRSQKEIFRGDMAVADDQDDQSREGGFNQRSILFRAGPGYAPSLSRIGG